MSHCDVGKFNNVPIIYTYEIDHDPGAPIPTQQLELA